MSNKKRSDETDENGNTNGSPEMSSRRDFLSSLGKWSTVIIAAVTAGNLAARPTAGWVNGRGGAWVNGRGGGGGSWVNRSVGGGAWVNRGGGGGWINGRGGGGGSWINRR